MKRSPHSGLSLAAGLAWLLVGWVLGPGCLSPTLPLPPPEEPDAIFSSQPGIWEVRGNCTPGAEIEVLNDSTGEGSIFVDRDLIGRYSVPIEGQACDVILISQSLGTEGSGETRAVLQEVDNGVALDPGACTQ